VEQALKKGVRFDAIQATNDQAAIGALKALKDNGIKVPEEVAICGFDNLFPGTLVNPAITTVHVPRYEIGVQAARELLRLIHDKGASPMGYTLSSKIVLRASSCPEATSTWSLEKW
jgi:DNA-binding LacI/PurR family transcriptional regulator